MNQGQAGQGFDAEFQRYLASETWSLYSVGMFVIILRTYARIHRVGARGLQLDDHLMLVAGGLYTMLVVCLNVIVTGGGSNLFPLEQLSTFTSEDIKQRIKGSKIVIISEQAMLNVIYTIKACMLIMFARLTTVLQQRRLISYISIYVVCGWIATELTFFLACRPFHGYWAVPPPNPQCTTLQHYAVIQAVFNISSDLLILGVMLPLFASMKNLLIKQKIGILALFGMGFFLIIAAILTKVFNLTDVYSPVYMLWYVREATTAICVSNPPMIWPLLREWFPRFWTQDNDVEATVVNVNVYGEDSRTKHGTGIAGSNWDIESGYDSGPVHLAHLNRKELNDEAMNQQSILGFRRRSTMKISIPNTDSGSESSEDP